MNKHAATRMRRVVGVLASAGLMAGIAATAVSPTATADADRLTTWTALNIRSGPGTDHAIVGGLYPGQLIEAAGPSRNGWTPVTFNGKKAWLSSRYVKVAGTGKASSQVADSTTASTEPGRRTTTTALNVRTGPSTSYRILNVLARGTAVATTGAYKNGYVEIRYDGRSAWVATQYLTGSTGSATSAGTSKLPKVVGTRVATTALMIRTNSTSNFQSLGDVPKGTKLSITGVTRNGVAQIIHKGAVRWVNANYLSKSKPATGTDISGISGNGLSGLTSRSKSLLVKVHDRYPQITWYN
ncbi:MAG TPA: SH3 domain-containing protein, partial [Bacillota bacterium]|nr:SH3 domain-containing protein [Bacillota bacterium]